MVKTASVSAARSLSGGGTGAATETAAETMRRIDSSDLIDGEGWANNTRPRALTAGLLVGIREFQPAGRFQIAIWVARVVVVIGIGVPVPKEIKHGFDG